MAENAISLRSSFFLLEIQIINRYEYLRLLAQPMNPHSSYFHSSTVQFALACRLYMMKVPIRPMQLLGIFAPYVSLHLYRYACCVLSVGR